MSTQGCTHKFDRHDYRARIEEKLGLSLDFDIELSGHIGSSSSNAPSVIPLTNLLESMQVPRSKLNKASAYIRHLINEADPALEGKYMRQGRGYLIINPDQTRETLLPILQREGFMQKQINRSYSAFFTSIQRTS